MFTFTKDDMTEEVKLIRAAQAEAADVPDEEWANWVSENRNLIRFSGNDGYVPDREEWIKRAEAFLTLMINPVTIPDEKPQKK
ncbi:MAG: hypothetical protein GY945_14330 [Rhodobacteraceae bacterium]|nr:hypothetical protein [Paracoccaceae bacterium]